MKEIILKTVEFLERESASVIRQILMNFASKTKKIVLFIFIQKVKKKLQTGISFADCQKIMTKYSNRFLPFG